MGKRVMTKTGADEKARKKAEKMNLAETETLRKMARAAGYLADYAAEKIGPGEYRLLTEHPVTLCQAYFFAIQEFKEGAEELLGKIDRTEPK